MDIKWPVPDANFYKINGSKIIKVQNKRNLDDEFYEYALKFQKSAHILYYRCEMASYYE